MDHLRKRYQKKNRHGKRPSKKQEAVLLDAKLEANPGLKERLEAAEVKIRACCIDSRRTTKSFRSAVRRRERKDIRLNKHLKKLLSKMVV
jgi:hypothetical protein